MATVSKAPDLTHLVGDLREALKLELGDAKTEVLLPGDLIKDTLGNITRLLETIYSAVEELLEDALQESVVVMLAIPGVFGNDKYQVHLRAEILDSAHQGTTSQHDDTISISSTTTTRSVTTATKLVSAELSGKGIAALNPKRSATSLTDGGT